MAEQSGFTRDDLRAGVASGIVSEAQAVRLLTLAETRAGTRIGMAGEDEPFELFKGFSEIFISVGLVLLISGLIGVAALMAHPVLLVGFAVALCWALAWYFTKQRRMVLPSIILVGGYATAVFSFMSYMVLKNLSFQSTTIGTTLTIGAAMTVALLLWYRVYKVPFTMFLLGLTGLAVIFSITDSLLPGRTGGFSEMFDLRAGSGLALGTLLFGVLAFMAGMWFDMADPHRLGRKAASGFWLHLLAAPALVNTVALTFYNMHNATGYALLALALACITLLALIIDRRSFLTAGIGYLAVLLALVLRSGANDMSWAGILLILGLFVTILGAFWNQARAGIMRALPQFPGKRHLPPYSEPI